MSIDLTTNYGGLTLRTPIVVGACPLTASEQTRIALASSGAGAIVLPSLFQEQVQRWNKANGRPSPETKELPKQPLQMLPDESKYEVDLYLDMVKRASLEMPIPVIASLNGESGGNWLDVAGKLQEAGAAGIELSVHHPAPSEYSDPREVEDSVVELVAEIDRVISIPLFVKLNRNYTSLSHLARRLLSGTQGMVLFGREPDNDVCLDSFELKSEWGLTHPGSVQRNLATIMRVHNYCPAMPIAASGGIGTSEDVIKALLMGADVAMVTSAVYRDGASAVRTLVDGLRTYMEKQHLTSIPELQEKRPFEFASDDARQDYLKNLSSRIDPAETRRDVSAMHGDRWGHVENS